jgi:hypothetical protein
MKMRDTGKLCACGCGKPVIRRHGAARYTLDCSLRIYREVQRKRCASVRARLRAKARRVAESPEEREALMADWGVA